MIGERMGRWPEALADAREAVLVAHEVGHLSMHAFTLAVLAHIEADLGHTDDARAHARESASLADRAGATNLGIYSYAALGRAELAVEAADAAAEALDEAARRRRLLAWREPAMVLDGADHVEALLRTGRRDEAAEALERLAGQAETAGRVGPRRHRAGAADDGRERRRGRARRPRAGLARPRAHALRACPDRAGLGERLRRTAAALTGARAADPRAGDVPRAGRPALGASGPSVSWTPPEPVPPSPPVPGPDGRT